MQVEARPRSQPLPDLGVLVRRIVVQHEVDVQLRRHLPVDQPQERQELLVVRHVIIFGYGHGLQRAIIDESQHRTPERLIMAQH